MEADMCLKVEPLRGEDALNLFYEKGGKVVLLPNIQDLEVDVVKQCGGLPLAIITMGKAMRGKERKQVWLDALRALKESAVPEIEGMESEVFRSLKLSYDYLEEYNIKLCFLYCALYPDDYKIDVSDLVRYWTMEGFDKNVDDLENASNKAYKIFEILKDACLLEECRSEESLLEESNSYFVKMHDLIRDLAIWITSSSSVEQGPKFLVKAGMGLKEAPKENMWEGVARVSLMVNDIKRLPTRPNCPTLVSLFLQKNLLGTIPSSFFELMPILGVLDLSDTNIESLPISFSSLVNLRILNLSKCRSLTKVPPLEHLTQLQFLDLKKCSAIGELPQDIGELVKLKRLDLSYLQLVTTIPCGTIRKLSSLEQLITIGTPIEWAKEERRPHLEWAKDENEGTSCSLAELAKLTRLDLLDITVKDIDCLAQDSFQLSSLSKFHLEFGKTEFGKTSAYKFTLPLCILIKNCAYMIVSLSVFAVR
ncbi:disease resistance protein At4g27190-like [Tasmannia lanceolata]|uniref:disease resistance protein At4g27190-like n=1 Tax=Tasmannia lanceolata TaxID=3420 RepID=UPI004064C660